MKRTTPGIHKSFDIFSGRFSQIERTMLLNLSENWFLTYSGETVQIKNSSYDYFLMRPIHSTSVMFNFNWEVVCILSPYKEFFELSLDVFDVLKKKGLKNRHEDICIFVFSADSQIENKIRSISHKQKERPIIIPFTYEEMARNNSIDFVHNRIRKYFYSRDLFDFSSPLKDELYFFARDQVVQKHIQKHRVGEHSGLFGLRKSGKTSIIYAIERKLASTNSKYVSIDCESPSIHRLRWNLLLQKIVLEYKSAVKSKVELEGGDRYSDTSASDSFEADMLSIYKSKKSARTLFLFDEIERITPGTASSPHWNNEDDFIHFWQSMRGFFQRHPEVMTYMLVGTNPSCVEKPKILGHENPIYNSVTGEYIPNFTHEEVTEMVSLLGGYMGMKFDADVFTKLWDDFGGHPFLIRQMCSKINRGIIGDRPVRIDKALYLKSKKEFYEQHQNYLGMIVDVLDEHYRDEFDMLKYLALGNEKSFNDLANLGKEFTHHLEGYGIIKSTPNGHVFNIELMKTYIQDKSKYARINLSLEEKWAEISERRNRIEVGLRVLIKRTLKMNHGNKALSKLLSCVPTKRREMLQDTGINTLLSKHETPLFFLDLINTIDKEWGLFLNIFDKEKARVLIILQDINSARVDAHAKEIDDREFEMLRYSFEYLEEILEEWG